MRPLSGLVLCGGASRRMGRDKALIEIDGEPLVLRVARRLSRVADPVLLAPGRPGRLGDLGYAEVADGAVGAGPLSGLVAGLASAPHPLVAVAAVDMPHVSPSVFLLLADLHRDEDAVVPVDGRGPQPLHAVYARTARPALASALGRGQPALLDALAQLRVREVTQVEWMAADPSGRFATNVNVPEDLPGGASTASIGNGRVAGPVWGPARSRQRGEGDE